MKPIKRLNELVKFLNYMFDTVIFDGKNECVFYHYDTLWLSQIMVNPYTSLGDIREVLRYMSFDRKDFLVTVDCVVLKSNNIQKLNFLPNQSFIYVLNSIKNKELCCWNNSDINETLDDFLKKSFSFVDKEGNNLYTSYEKAYCMVLSKDLQTCTTRNLSIIVSLSIGFNVTPKMVKRKLLLFPNYHAPIKKCMFGSEDMRYFFRIISKNEEVINLFNFFANKNQLSYNQKAEILKNISFFSSVRILTPK